MTSALVKNDQLEPKIRQIATYLQPLPRIVEPSNYAILTIMQSREEWASWAELLQRLHLDQFTAWALEAGGPLALLGAQALYFSRSFIGPRLADPLARTLEDEGELRAFITYLNSGQTHD